MITDAMVRAATESRASDDEGRFEMLGDLLGFSGENKTRTVVDAALRAALAAWQPTIDWREDGNVAYFGASCVGYVRKHSVHGYLWVLHRMFYAETDEEGTAPTDSEARAGLEQAFTAVMHRFLQIED